MFCTNCGKDIAEVRVCPYCGKKTKLFYEADVEKSVPVAEEMPVKEENAPARVRSGAYKKENSNKTLIIIIAALLAVLLCLGAFLAIFLINNTDKPEAIDDPGVIITEPADEEPETVPVNVYGDDIDYTEEGRYIVVSEKCTWLVANEKAKAYGDNTHLVTFNSLAEFDYVCNLVKDAKIRNFWAGVRVGSVSQWANEPYDVFKKKFKMSSVRWLENEPSGYDYNLPEEERIFEECLGVIDLNERGFLANDVHATAEYAGYVIEIEK